MYCPEREIDFELVGGDCLGKPFVDNAPMPSDSDSDVAARECEHYMKFIHAPKGDWKCVSEGHDDRRQVTHLTATDSLFA